MPKTYHVMAKPAGAACNLACTYCFYLEKTNLYPATNKIPVMPNDVLETFIRQRLEMAVTNEVAFTWQGGEPTLCGLDFFRRAVHLQNKYANSHTVTNSIQTNGILLDDDWCTFLAEHNFLVGISIDGPAELHDRYRVDKGDGPTFDKVLRAIDLLRKYAIAFNTLTVVNSCNGDLPLEVYEFLKSIGSTYLQFIPVVERENDKVTDWSVRPEQFGNFLKTIYDSWIRNDVGKIFVQLFDVTLEAWYGLPPSLCIFNQTCGLAPALEHNGDLYSCDHYVFPEYRLGNLLEQPLSNLMESTRQNQFGRDKQTKLPKYCRECPALFVCNGGCPKNRFSVTPDGEPGLNYLCKGYKSFFTRSADSMKFMANELHQRRAPANVMEWIKSTD